MNRLNFEVKAFLTVLYLDEYSKLEKKVKDIFTSNLKKFDNELINKLYFYYGANHSSNHWIDYTKNDLKSSITKFKKEEKFKSFSLIIIANILKDYTENILNFKVKLLNHNKVEQSFLEICKNLVSVRNKLAHEGFNYTIDQKKDIIEKLSVTYIKKYFEKDSYITSDQIKRMDDDDISIISNLIYMKYIICKLDDLNKE